MVTFESLGLLPTITKALSELGYENPTEIQEKAIPQVIASKQDLKAFAQTGTGKTAAFSLPILHQVDANDETVQAIILSPTRELAIQIADNIRDFSKYMKNVRVATVYGGAAIEEQIRKLKRGAQIVVGTPGRTVDLIKRGSLKLHNVQWLVLDEADEMLNMGFKDELDQVLEVTPDTKQTLLFSATFPKEVDRIARNYMHDPTQLEAGQKNTGSDNVSHEFYMVTDRNRYPALKRIADMHPDIYGIIFCRTRRETKDIADKLIEDGYNADALHGDLSQAQRDTVMQKFRKKNLQLLVATDVAARGLDVNNLTHVINYKLPDQIEPYTHRSGRTGRANSKGVSIAIVNPNEKRKLSAIEKVLKKKFVQKQVPSGKEICEKQLFSLIDKVHDIEINEAEIAEYIPTIEQKLKGLSREELIQRFVSIEFNSFLSYYENAKDLNDLTGGNNERRRNSNNENMTRFFINIGRKDRLNPSRLMGLINEQRIAPNIEIGDIDILDTFSFFELDKNYTQETVDTFLKNEVVFEGRGVSVEITEKRKGGRGGRRGRSGGGDKKFRNKSNRRAKESSTSKPKMNTSGFGRKRDGSKGRNRRR